LTQTNSDLENARISERSATKKLKVDFDKEASRLQQELSDVQDARISDEGTSKKLKDDYEKEVSRLKQELSDVQGVRISDEAATKKPKVDHEKEVSRMEQELSNLERAQSIDEEFLAQVKMNHTTHTTELNNKIDFLENLLKGKDTLIRTHIRWRTQKTEKIIKLQDSFVELKETHDKTQEEHEQLSFAYDMLQEECQENKDEKLRLQSDLTTTQTMLETAKIDLSVCETQLQSSQSDLETTHKTLETAKIDLSVCEATLKSSNADLETTRKTLETAKIDLSTSDVELKSLRSDLATTQTMLETAKTDLSVREATLKSSNADLEITRKTLETAKIDLSTSESKLNSWQSDLETTRTMLETAKIDLSTSEAKLESSNSDLATARTMSETAERTVELTKSKFQAANYDLNSSRVKLEATQADLKFYQALLQSTQLKSDTLLSDLQSANLELETYQLNLESTRADLESSQTDFKDAVAYGDILSTLASPQQTEQLRALMTDPEWIDSVEFTNLQEEFALESVGKLQEWKAQDINDLEVLEQHGKECVKDIPARKAFRNREIQKPTTPNFVPELYDHHLRAQEIRSKIVGTTARVRQGLQLMKHQPTPPVVQQQRSSSNNAPSITDQTVKAKLSDFNSMGLRDAIDAAKKRSDALNSIIGALVSNIGSTPFELCLDQFLTNSVDLAPAFTFDQAVSNVVEKLERVGIWFEKLEFYGLVVFVFQGNWVLAACFRDGRAVGNLLHKSAIKTELKHADEVILVEFAGLQDGEGSVEQTLQMSKYMTLWANYLVS
jgi:hypothetical protein